MDSIVQYAIRELLNLNNYISTFDLAGRLGISESSLKHRINEIREIVSEHGAELSRKSGKGIHIEASDETRELIRQYLNEISYSLSESDEYRKNYILKILFEFPVNYTIQLFSDELFVSRNRITKDICELNEKLEEYQVKIVCTKNSGVSLCGNEFAIRQAIIAQYNSLWWNEEYMTVPETLDVRISDRAWTYMTRMYADIDLLEIQNRLKKIENIIGTVFTDIAFARLFEYVVVSERRIKNNKIIAHYNSKELLPVEKEYMEAARLILENYIPKVPKRKSKFESEIRYLAARIFVAPTIYPKQYIYFEEDVIIRYLHGVIAAIGKSNFKINQEMIDMIATYITSATYKENYHIIDWSDISKDAKKNISELYTICMGGIDILEGRGVKLTSDDIAMIALIISNYTQEQKKKAVFVTATDRVTAAYQMSRLQVSFPECEFVKSIHYRDFMPERCAGALVISTVRLPDAESIKITKHVDEKDIQIISEKLLSDNQYTKKTFEKITNIELMWDLNASNKKDTLKKIYGYLTKNDYVTEDFYDALIAREKKTPTSVGHGMAVPHVLGTGVLEDCMVVVKLKHSVLWNKHDVVDLIFLFALKERGELDLVEIFGSLYNLISNRQTVSNMKKSPEEFWKTIQCQK